MDQNLARLRRTPRAGAGVRRAATGAGRRRPDASADAQPGFGSRGRARRRARFLRKARELAYRDLGGLVFNLHRFGQRNDALVLAKLGTLGHIDTELRALEDALRRARAGDGAARGRHHRLPALRRDPRQRGPLLPQLRPVAGRHADLPIAGAAGRAAPRRREPAQPRPRPQPATARPRAAAAAAPPAAAQPPAGAAPPAPVDGAAAAPAPAPAAPRPAPTAPAGGDAAPAPPAAGAIRRPAPPQRDPLAGAGEEPTEIIRPRGAGP